MHRAGPLRRVRQQENICTSQIVECVIIPSIRFAWYVERGYWRVVGVSSVHRVCKRQIYCCIIISFIFSVAQRDFWSNHDKATVHRYINSNSKQSLNRSLFLMKNKLELRGSRVFSFRLKMQRIFIRAAFIVWEIRYKLFQDDTGRCDECSETRSRQILYLLLIFSSLLSITNDFKSPINLKN